MGPETARLPPGSDELFAGDLVIPPPHPQMLDYPGAVGTAFLILFTTIMLFVAGKFDPTGGVLTISLTIILGFLAVVAFTMFYTVPSNEITSSVIGGLTAAFGAVVTLWLGRNRKDPP
jgi:uncharacterized BrkB/YihY/UPF0761 family membrane protein